MELEPACSNVCHGQAACLAPHSTWTPWLMCSERHTCRAEALRVMP
jgi:hypothetical protein